MHMYMNISISHYLFLHMYICIYIYPHIDTRMRTLITNACMHTEISLNTLMYK